MSVQNSCTPVTKVGMLASMLLGKGDIALIHKNIRGACAMSLRPDNVGIASYEHELYSYRELLVMRVEVSQETGVSQILRFQELFHHSIPYPLFLWFVRGVDYFLSAVPLRHSRAEKNVEIWEDSLTKCQCKGLARDFLSVLRPAYGPTDTLRDLYMRWIRALYGLMIGSLCWERVLGQAEPFFLPDTIDDAKRIWQTLSCLFNEWKSLDSQLNKERQPNKRVDLGNRRFTLRERIREDAKFIFRALPE